mmetsp:Transcript_10695/g.37431  ORF Transcript_10695/g.37431 Transcript_10695/m.37431 type:complete len:102 (+) Transcript_10695:695-1000(+)
MTRESAESRTQQRTMREKSRSRIMNFKDWIDDGSSDDAKQNVGLLKLVEWTGRSSSTGGNGGVPCGRRGGAAPGVTMESPLTTDGVQSAEAPQRWRTDATD